MPWTPVVRKNGLSFTERRRHWDRILKLSSLRTTDYRPCLLLLLLLSCFSCVWLCATPQTAAHQASLSLAFSRQEHWSGLPFLSPMHESEKWKWKVKSKSESEVAQSCPTLCDPMDYSLSGFSVHGISQASVLEWVAIAFSDRPCLVPCNCNLNVWFTVPFFWKQWGESKEKANRKGGIILSN